MLLGVALFNSKISPTAWSFISLNVLGGMMYALPPALLPFMVAAVVAMWSQWHAVALHGGCSCADAFVDNGAPVT